MNTTTEPTAKQYANLLIQLLLSEYRMAPTLYANVRSWGTLHDVVDANEFIVYADRMLGTDTLANEDNINRTNEAIALVERTLWKEE